MSNGTDVINTLTVRALIRAVCVFVVGFEDECIMDSVLRPPQCVCTYIRMDPVPQSSGGLWHWRSSTIVSVTQIWIHTQLLRSLVMLGFKKNVFESLILIKATLDLNILNIFSYLIYSCDGKAEFSASLLQFSVSHDLSEIILICWFGAQVTFLIISIYMFMRSFSRFFAE